MLWFVIVIVVCKANLDYVSRVFSLLRRVDVSSTRVLEYIIMTT
jgi:hypothetical protein